MQRENKPREAVKLQRKLNDLNSKNLNQKTKKNTHSFILNHKELLEKRTDRIIN